MIIDQARERMTAEHNRIYRGQQKYLDGYLAALDRLQKMNDQKASAKDLQEYEKPRIEYRNTYLQLRRE